MDYNVIDLFSNKKVTASIDKLTLCGHSSKDILHDDIEMLVAKYGNNQYLFEEFTSVRFMSWSRLIKISYKHFYPNGTYEVFSIAIMIGFNGHNMCGTSEEQHRFQIEFNPNKFVIPGFLRGYFIKRDYKIETIKNIDLAFDFEGFRKESFKYQLNSANTKVASIGSQNNKTDYIGFSDKSKNRIKIYDKKKERSKYYHMDMETTRVEITLEYRHKVSNTYLDNSDFENIIKACDSLGQLFVNDTITDDGFCLCSFLP